MHMRTSWVLASNAQCELPIDTLTVPPPKLRPCSDDKAIVMTLLDAD